MKSSAFVYLFLCLIIINSSTAFSWSWSGGESSDQDSVVPFEPEPLYEINDDALHMPLIPRLEHLERLVSGANKLNSKDLTKRLEKLENLCFNDWKGHGTIEQRFKRLMFNVKNIQKELHDVEIKLFGTHNTESIQARIEKIRSNGFSDIKGNHFLEQVKNIRAIIIGNNDNSGSSEFDSNDDIATETQTREMLIYIMNMIESKSLTTNQKNQLELGDSSINADRALLELDDGRNIDISHAQDTDKKYPLAKN